MARLHPLKRSEQVTTKQAHHNANALAVGVAQRRTHVGVNSHLGQQGVLGEEAHHILAVCIHPIRDHLGARGSSQTVRERLGALAVTEDRDNFHAGTVQAQLAHEGHVGAQYRGQTGGQGVEERGAPLTGTLIVHHTDRFEQTLLPRLPFQ